MASGGVASPTDPVGAWGYSEDEIRAIVAEARARQTYVLAHAYTAEAISRAVRCGVRTIEHGNLVDAEAARLMAGQGAYVVPTLITYEALANEGADLGLPADSVAKVAQVRNAGLHSLEIYRDAGVPMGFGTDLLGPSHRLQSEFRLRAEVLGAPAVIASATQVGARVLGMEGKLGVIAPGACADMLMVDGNPLRDGVLPAGAGRAHPAGDAERQGAVRRAGRLSGRRGRAAWCAVPSARAFPRDSTLGLAARVGGPDRRPPQVQEMALLSASWYQQAHAQAQRPHAGGRHHRIAHRAHAGRLRDHARPRGDSR